MAGAGASGFAGDEGAAMRVVPKRRAVPAALLWLAAAGGALPAAGVASAAAGGAPPAATPDAARESWPDVKCARYRKATADAIARLTTRGLGRAFLDGHEAFLVSNCTDRTGVCPRSEEELRLANVLVMAGMNAGLSSTFFPFSCRR